MILYFLFFYFLNMDETKTHVFPKDYAIEWVDSTHRWTPTVYDIEQAEELIKSDIKKRLKKPKTALEADLSAALKREKPETYYRQCVGPIDSSGNQIVWVNFICSKQIHHYPDWKERIISVRGGGSCYFNLKVNLTNHEVYDLIVNGLR